MFGNRIGIRNYFQPIFAERAESLLGLCKRWIRFEGPYFFLSSQLKTGKCQKVVGARDIRAPALSKLDVDVFVVLPDLRIECNT